MKGSIDEQSPLLPNNIYGITKLEGERVVLSYKAKLPIAIVRISETYGPGDRRLLKLFKGIQKKVFFIIGKGENLHHVTFIDDLIEGLFLAAESRNALGEVFVLAGKEAVTTKAMVEEIAEQSSIDPDRTRKNLNALRERGYLGVKVKGGKTIYTCQS